VTRTLSPGRAALAAWVLIAVAAVAGCRSAGEDVPDKVTIGGGGIGARLTSLGGSAMGATVTFQQRDGFVAMLAGLRNAAPGRSFRVVIHANGNCSSPNGFSAGPPWAPPGKADDLRHVVISTNSEGTGSVSARLPGWRLEGPDGLVGRSVVIHDGATGSLEAEPGVRNNRAACGVIGPMRGVTL
jgi:Cu-Zn family superoxide dismutase